MLDALLFFRAAGRVGLRTSLLLAMLWPAATAAQPAAPASHCLLLPLEPARRAQQSALVVEAEVLDARSFWNAGHTRLFTRHRLRVFSLLKGAVADTAGLVLVTEGGRLGLDQQVLTNTLQLVAGQQGIFFLITVPWTGLLVANQSRSWTPFGSEQGLIAYDLAEGTAAEPFRSYPAIDAAFYREITRLTGQPRRVLQPNPALVPGAGVPMARGGLAPVISNFSPQQLPAGAGAVLTLNGSGFGSSRGSGSVEFRNADDGGATRVQARAADYLSWTDTRIQVRVPSSASGGQPVSGGHPAGSGTVRVTTNNQLATESATVLTVIYALTNVASIDGAVLQRPNHIAQNANGGIIFRPGSNFTANAAASAAFQRALASWRCQTGMNWEVGAVNANNVIADDNLNVVAFDAGADLPDRVLGRTTSYYKGCQVSGGEVIFWLKEVDMQFDDGAVFQFGPAPAVGTLNQIDFETVAVHELGHAHQLTHLILPGAVMHFAIGRGQNSRVLNPQSDVAGGRQVLRVRSFRNLGCSGPAMLPAPLISLKAQPTGGAITVSWATRDECFLNGFVVERSQGPDTTNWQPVSTVAARPPANEYQFTDAQAPGGLRYYRLRLLRPDGSLDNAAPVVASTEAAIVSIFPNPVTGDELSLQYPAGANGTVSLRVYDELGRRIRSVNRATTAGINVLRVDIAGLAVGFYVLRWQDAQGGQGNRKFIRI